MRARRLVALTALAALLILAGLGAPGPQPPIAAQAAEPAPALQGAWLDSMVFTQQTDAGQAVAQLQADELDLYAGTVIDPALFQVVSTDPSLAYTTSMGSYRELTFNPAGPEFNDGRLNPFSNVAIRAAMNRLVDRDHIVQEIYGGLGLPKYTSLNPLFPEYDRQRTTVEAIEAACSYDLTQAQQAIAAEMTAMDATLQGGIWTYDGAPVTIIFIIRTEDKRREIGDYVADQLEQIGFAVDRQYKPMWDASVIWNQSDPAEGLWHLYTGGWMTTAVSRDDATDFGWFYTPLGSGSPLWQAYRPTAEFLDVATRLWNDDFDGMQERNALFEQGLTLALEDAGAAPPEGAGSVRVWLVDETSFAPQRAEIAVSSDLVGGVAWAQTFAREARLEGAEGGSLRIAQPGELIGPWNPIAGSRSAYDQFPIQATEDYGLIRDPNTALYWPQHVESVECVVKEGLPVGKTLDWITLSTASAIAVPADAWADWDAATQTFIEAGDMPSPILEANYKCAVTYPADLFTTVTWHDGSPLDLSDFIMRMILTFDLGKPESAIYDDSLEPQVEDFLSHFRGVTIDSLYPLVITTYDDQTYLDAEWMVTPWWPNYSQGPGAWHNLAVAIRAEAAGELAFSTDKAESHRVQWTSFIDGSSLPVLENWMNRSAAEGYIPYLPTMGAYVTEAEAGARWAALQAWYSQLGHFWLGTGPFYLAWSDQFSRSLALGRYEAGEQPQVAINHAGGAPGSYLNVTGTGFPPGRTALVAVNGTVVGSVDVASGGRGAASRTLLGSVPVDSAGALGFTLSTDQALAGAYEVRVGVNWFPSVQFTLDKAEPLRPRVGDLPVVVVPAGLIRHYTYMPVALRAYSPGLLYFDGFSDHTSGWPHDSSGDVQRYYVGGEYEMYTARSGLVVGTGSPFGFVSGSYSVEADARRWDGSDVEYGITIENDEEYYAYWFFVKPASQEWTLWNIVSDENWAVLASGTSGTINAGDATNHLKAERKGDEIVVSVNGHVLATVTDTTHQGGWVGLDIWARSDVPAAARFDNFAVRSPDGALAGAAPPQGEQESQHFAVEASSHE